METTNLQNKKILWVEDDKFLSSLLAKKLNALEAKLFHSSTGADAYDIAVKERPSVIVLDLLLPGISGYDILQKVRNDESIANIPVIVFSNLGQKADIEKAKTLGVTKFIIKATMSLDEIVKEIQKVIS